MSALYFFLTFVGLVGAWDDTNFLDWFEDSLDEAIDAPLVFEGTVPSYLAGGTFVQTGPARFGFGKMRFTHMLDGYSKTNTLSFSKDLKATYTSKFLASGFMNASIEDGGIARGMFVGEIEPPPHWGPTAVTGANDNNYIKMRKIGDQQVLLADVMVATETKDDCVTFKTNVRSELMAPFVSGINWDDWLQPMGDMCMLGTMAHGVEDPVTGHFTGAMGCFGAQGNYHQVFYIEPSAPTVRKHIAKIDLGRERSPSYMHSFGATPDYIILIADPLYMSLEKVLEGAALGKGGLYTNGDKTLFQVVNRANGSVRTLEAPGFIYGHVFNSYQEGDDIVIDLEYYGANNATTLGWVSRWFLEYMTDQKTREAWPKAEVVRYRLKANNEVEKTVMFADEKGQNDFTTPKINEKLEGHPYCISYMLQFHSYEYDVDMQAIEPGPMGAVGLAKRNHCTGERSGLYEPNRYPSEVQFIADPAGTAEDDGVLLGITFDGNTNSSFFHIMDARTMKVIAKAPLPVRSPFLIHSSWFPGTKAPLTISV